MIDWTQIIMALIVGLPAILAAWKSYKAVQEIDKNTVITKRAETAAEVAARSVEAHREETATAVAAKVEEAVTKVDAKTANAVTDIKKMLNGDMDKRIRSIVQLELQVLHKEFIEHARVDEANMSEIRQALAVLAQRK